MKYNLQIAKSITGDYFFVYDCNQNNAIKFKGKYSECVVYINSRLIDNKTHQEALEKIDEHRLKIKVE